MDSPPYRGSTRTSPLLYSSPNSAMSSFALHRAALEGDVETLRALLALATPDELAARDPNGNTALHLAIHYKQHGAVKLLLDAGANPLSRSGAGWLAMQESVASGNAETITAVYERCVERARQVYGAKIPKIIKALKEVRDIHYTSLLGVRCLLLLLLWRE